MKVFSKKKFKEAQGYTEVEARKYSWVNKCDGKTVEELKKMPYVVSNDWLVEEEDYKKGEDNMEFKKGERVKHNIFGEGTVLVNSDSYSHHTSVEFDKENSSLHDCCGLGRRNHCWNCDSRDLKKVEIITSKDDLKNGDIVTLRNGDRLVFVNGEDFIDLSDDNDNCLSDIRDLEDDLRHDSYEDSDIVKVERPVEYTTVFTREEVKEMTVEEISKALGYEVKVVK